MSQLAVTPRDFASIVRPQFLQVKYLGGGSFGHVFEVKDEVTGCSFALKKISVEGYKFHYKDEVVPFTKIMREVELLKTVLEHCEEEGAQYIVKLENYWIEGPDKDKPEELNKSFRLLYPNWTSTQREPQSRNFLYLQMELLQMSLNTWLKDPGREKAQWQYHHIFHQLLKALDFIHTRKPNGIVHRDIKPDNIFLSLKETELLLKLGDFGLGRVLREDKSRVSTKQTGNSKYRSPEMWRDDGYYDTKTDVFSAGLCLLELVVNYEGKLLGISEEPGISNVLGRLFHEFQTKGVHDLESKVNSVDFEYEVEIIKRMTVYDKTLRCTATDALSYFSDIESFITLIQRERKEAQLFSYGIPSPSTSSLYRRSDQLSRIKAMFSPSSPIVWIQGQQCVGLTELAKTFSREEVKSEMHRVWLEAENIEKGLEELASSLGLNIDNEASISEKLSSILNYISQIKGDNDAPILVILHDVDYVYEVEDLVQKSLLNKGTDRVVYFLICSNRSVPSATTKITLEPLDQFSIRQILETYLPQNIVTPIKEKKEILGKISTLCLGLPGIARTLCSLVWSHERTQYPMSLNACLDMLEGKMSSLLLFQKDDRDPSIYDVWKARKNRMVFLQNESKNILTCICVGFLGKESVSEIEETYDFVGDANDFVGDLTTNNLCEVEVDEYKAQVLENLSVLPLVRELVKLELVESVEENKDFISKLLKAAERSNFEKSRSFLKAVQNFWEFIAHRDSLLEEFLAKFCDLTVQLGGSWERIPLDHESRTYFKLAETRERYELILSKVEKKRGRDVSYFTILSYYTMYKIDKDIKKDGVKDLISLRRAHLQDPTLMAFNVDSMVMERCCLIVSHFVLTQKVDTRSTVSMTPETQKSIVDWVIAEIQERNCLEIDFVAMVLLSVIKYEKYEHVVRIAEVLIKEWYRFEAFLPETLIVNIVFIHGIVVRFLQNEGKGNKTLLELEEKLSIIKTNTRTLIVKGISDWKFTLFDTWPKWFSQTLTASSRSNLDLFVQFLVYLFSVLETMEASFFEEYRAMEKLVGDTKRLAPALNAIENLLEEVIMKESRISRLYLNYLFMEVYWCRCELNLEGKKDFTTNSVSQNLTPEQTFIDDISPCLVALVMFEDSSDAMKERLNRQEKHPGHDILVINNLGCFEWASGENSEGSSVNVLMKSALKETLAMVIPELLRKFDGYAKQLGSYIAHLLLSKFTMPWLSEISEGFTKIEDDNIHDKVTSLAYDILLRRVLYEENKVFSTVTFLILSIIRRESQVENGSFLLRNLMYQLSVTYDTEERQIEICKRFFEHHSNKYCSLETLEKMIDQICLQFSFQSYNLSYQVSCLNLLRQLMRVQCGARFLVEIVNEENILEERSKIIRTVLKSGIWECEMDKKKPSLTVVIILWYSCVSAAEDSQEARDLLRLILSHLWKKQDYLRIRDLFRALTFGGHFKEKCVWEKVMSQLGEPICFPKLEAMIHGKVFKKKEELNNECKDEDTDDALVI